MVEPLSLKANMLWNSVGSFFYLLCNWLITVLVVLLAKDFGASGSLSIAMSVGNIFATIVLFRIRPVQVSDTSQNHDTRDYVALRIITLLLASLFCFVYSYFTVDASNYQIVGLYLAFKGADSFVDVYHAEDQKQGRLDYVGKSQIIRGILILSGFATGLIVFQSLVVSVLMMSISSLAVVLLYDIPRTSQFCRLLPVFRASVLFELLKCCSPGFIASLALTMITSLVRQEYGMIHGNELLGIYSAVATPTVVVQALASYIYAPLYGPISKLKETGNAKGIFSIIIKFLLIIFVAFLVLCVLSMLVGTQALELLYGQTIGQHSALLYGILLCTASSATSMFLVDILIITHDYRAAFVSGAIPLGLCLILLTFVASSPDMNMISMVAAVCYLVSIVLSLISLRRNRSF